MANFKDDQLVVIVAGSQGQEGSSMVRAVFGEHSMIQINERDKVIVSADAIPGNEVPYYRAINELCRNKIPVIYPDIKPNIHHTGHAGTKEQQEIIKLAQPQYLMPIGGADRHRELFRTRVAHPLNYRDEQVLIPQTGQVILLQDGSWQLGQRINLSPKIVDGLGVGDVGPVVLSDRRALGEAGIVVVIVSREKGEYQLNDIEVISRGFVFMKQANEVIGFIQETAAEIITHNQQTKDFELKQMIEKGLQKKLYKIIQREPVIVTAILDR